MGPTRTPQQSPALGPGAPPALEEWNIDEQPGDTQADSAGQGRLDKLYERWGDDEGEDGDPNAFESQYLIGEWTDNLGHTVIVSPTETGGRRDRRGRKKGKGKGKGPQLGFLAVMYKFGMPDKRFNINKDRSKINPKHSWTCGNGVLCQETSTTEDIVWKTADGRISTWKRTPPEGPVFFDAPPMQMMPEVDDWHDEYWGGPPQGEWKGLHLPPDGDLPLQAQESTGNGGEAAGASAEDAVTAAAASAVNATSGEWNKEAPEFVMPTFAAVPASNPGTPMLVPAAAPATPRGMPVHPAPVGVQAQACMLSLSEESPDVTITANCLEWVLPDNWGKLSRFPKDFCLTSPMFGVRQATNMQLVFYPNGSRTAEAGRCTVALTRGPDSAGIKFEFSVNGRGSGPKVCLGRRYLGDYPKPYDESEESKLQQVSVCMQVLEVLGATSH